MFGFYVTKAVGMADFGLLNNSQEVGEKKSVFSRALLWTTKKSQLPFNLPAGQHLG